MPSPHNNLYGVILAGGSGTRFWPLSRKSKPKQFQNIVEGGTLFQQTLARISPKVAPRNTLIVANKSDLSQIKDEIARFGIPSSNILLEPEGRNTAPAICWAAFRISLLHPEGIMVVLPSDHLITNGETFLKTLEQAVRLASKDYLVTMGIAPSRPETGYGYLQTRSVKSGKKSILKVEKFVEKPNAATAKKFLRSKKHFWNSGMFAWKAGVILEEFRQHSPSVYNLLKKTKDITVAGDIWSKMPNISIDYAILEKSKRVVAVPATSIGWSDLGSWEALAQILKKDKDGNTFRGDVISAACRNTFVWPDKKLIAVAGLEDVVIVDTPDALLVCRKDRSQKVKDVVGTLNKRNRGEV